MSTRKFTGTEKKALIIGLAIIMALCAVAFSACGSDEPASSGDGYGSDNGDGSSDGGSDVDNGNSGSATTGAIDVLTREQGSGTRSAFAELFGVVDDNKIDIITQTAEVTNSTAVMMTTVAGDPQAIGYLSLGSLDSSVKALDIDGVKATTDNVANGSYSIQRPFNIVTKTGGVSAEAQDFIDYIMSAEGQAVIAEHGYISIAAGTPFAGGSVSGKITVSGSSSVTPIMQKLQEAYNKVNADLEIEVQQSDSSTGIKDATDGISEIGMASRELKDEEASQGISATEIALDGIAVIVNPGNSLTGLTKDQVKEIFLGNVTSWDGLK